MVGRIVRTADFERVLAAPPRSRSAHFAAHHVAARPSLPGRGGHGMDGNNLSTSDAPSCPPVVDDLPVTAAGGPPAALAGVDDWWLGMVVPKRHARRSVTRTLIKRQMREALRRATAAPGLAPGLWVLRLKAPFDRASFPSAASAPLKKAARDELDLLLHRALREPPTGGGQARPGAKGQPR